MTDLTVWVCLGIAGLIVAMFTKPAKTMVGGFIQKDSKGRLILILTPTPKPKRQRRRRK